MKIHTCKICSANSDTSVFYDKMFSRCAACHRAKVKENRAGKADYYRAYDAKRFQEDPRVLERHKRYGSTESGAASMALARAKWQSQNPDKRAAHIILGNAVKNGRIVKPKICHNCGNGGRIHGHHHDYALPLDVTWLCSKCHTAEHREMKDTK